MMNSQSISANTMSNIVLEFSKLCVLRTNVRIRTWASRSVLQVKPESIESRPSNSVSSEDIVWMSDPHTCWTLICVQQAPRLSDINDQIVLYQIVRLNSILNKDRMSHSSVGNVILHSQEMNTVDCHCSVKGMVNSVVPDVRVMHSADHVEMQRISAQLEGLTHISEFSVLYSSCQRVVSGRVEHYMSAILLRG